MIDRWRPYIPFGVLFAIAFGFSCWRIQNFDENYFNIVFYAALSIAIVGVAHWEAGWRKLLSEPFWISFLRAVTLWTLILFWWADDYTTDYWHVVLTGSLGLSALTVVLRWVLFVFYKVPPARKSIAPPPPPIVPPVAAKPEPVATKPAPVVTKPAEPQQLTGDVGESAAHAAGRFGIELRFRGKNKWLGRRGDDVYWMEYPPRRGPGAAKPQVTFQRLDEHDVSLFEQFVYFDLDGEKFISRLMDAKSGQKVSGWEVLQRGTEDLLYNEQRYDGDFAHFVEVVDPIGRCLHFRDHGDHRWLRDLDGEMFKPKWNW